MTERHADRPRDILVGTRDAAPCSQLCSQQCLSTLPRRFRNGVETPVQLARMVP